MLYQQFEFSLQEKKKYSSFNWKGIFWLIWKEISEKQILTYENSHKQAWWMQNVTQNFYYSHSYV